MNLAYTPVWEGDGNTRTNAAKRLGFLSDGNPPAMEIGKELTQYYYEVSPCEQLAILPRTLERSQVRQQPMARGDGAPQVRSARI
jgi:hypothetical protein